MGEYRLTPAAEHDLAAIWTYTVERWGMDQAQRYLDIMVQAFSELARSPNSSPACGHIRAGYRRRSVELHMVYYRVTDYGVAIIRVLHDRMDAASHV